MPAARHEVLIQLFRDAPELVGTILAERPDMTMLGEPRVRSSPESASVLQVAERRVDAVFEVEDDTGRFAVALEVQMRPEPEKVRRWPTYVARLRENLVCPVTLLVVCMSDRTAKWAAEPIFLGRPGSYIRPVALGPAQVPLLTDPTDPRATPQRALLSVLAHAKGRRRHNKALIDVFDHVLGTIDPQRATDYAEFAYELLSGPAVRYLEELVETRTKPYQRSTYRRLREEARDEGELKTLIRVLLETSEIRGIRLTAAQRRRVESCTDAELLHEWFRRAVSATTAEQIFA
ncbi:hypothetical protein LX16_0005 [Stackebrandtia albiflava]|uniref:Uncharacterized protein n=1 Tax=Stackebrandtia albiflava TaxID=406432 RepID=A0A562VGT8_9ACTN|nr:hypothetical protein [Stackebrandtia albiflava]TWJ17090.1 hypothetical protein LX16_0005 [Stackebrandtia albiflava]